MFEILRKLGATIPPILSSSIKGKYDWYDENGNYIASCAVDSSIDWTQSKLHGLDVVNIEVSKKDLYKIVDRATDPLLLLNTGKIRAYYHDFPADTEILRKLELLLNQMLTKQEDISNRGEAIATQSQHLTKLSGYLTFPDIHNLAPFLKLGLPAYIPSGIEQWKLLSLDKSEIVELAGRDLPVSLLKHEHSISKSKSAEYTSVSLSEYINMITDMENGKTVGYMAANSLPEALHAFVETPVVFPPESFNVPRWWIGAKGSGLKLHRDLVDNFLCQVKGQKIVTLINPLESDFVYPAKTGGNPLYEPCLFDLSQPDFEEYPLAKRITPVTCELFEGDLLYIPAGWWHAVENATESWSVNYFAVNRKPSVLCLDNQ